MRNDSFHGFLCLFLFMFVSLLLVFVSIAAIFRVCNVVPFGRCLLN